MRKLANMSNQELLDAYESLIYQKISNLGNFEALEYIQENKDLVEEEILFRLEKDKNEKIEINIEKYYEDMDEYEQAIAHELQKKYPTHYTENSAKEMLEKYYTVLKRIGWHWDPNEWAERLHKQVQRGKSPQEWMEDVIAIEKAPNRPNK